MTTEVNNKIYPPAGFSYFIETVKAMEVDERPTEKYTDVGGLDK